VPPRKPLSLFSRSSATIAPSAISIRPRFTQRICRKNRVLGARAEQVVQLFYVRGVKLGIVGLALGLPTTLVVMRVLESRTTSVANLQNPSVWLVGGIVAVMVLLVASIATLLPATRAATVDPPPRCAATSATHRNAK
jgi:predicted lysophospholipase L1 biosynthesis ABC-type transport system permease subunit